MTTETTDSTSAISSGEYKEEQEVGVPEKQDTDDKISTARRTFLVAGDRLKDRSAGMTIDVEKEARYAANAEFNARHANLMNP